MMKKKDKKKSSTALRLSHHDDDIQSSFSFKHSRISMNVFVFVDRKTSFDLLVKLIARCENEFIVRPSP